MHAAHCLFPMPFATCEGVVRLCYRILHQTVLDQRCMHECREIMYVIRA